MKLSAIAEALKAIAVGLRNLMLKRDRQLRFIAKNFGQIIEESIMTLTATIEELKSSIAELATGIASEKEEAKERFNSLENQINDLTALVQDLQSRATTPEDLATLAELANQVKASTAAVKEIVTTPVEVSKGTSEVVDKIALDETTLDSQAGAPQIADGGEIVVD